MSNFDENKINRQASGTSTGGQFANKDHPANDGVDLLGTQAELEYDWDSLLADVERPKPEVFTPYMDQLASQFGVQAVAEENGREVSFIGPRGTRRTVWLSDCQSEGEVRARLASNLEYGPVNHIEDELAFKPMARQAEAEARAALPELPDTLDDVDCAGAVSSYLGYAFNSEAERLDEDLYEEAVSSGADEYMTAGNLEFSSESRWVAENDLRTFMRDNAEDVAAVLSRDDYDQDSLALDLYLTRNHDGTGFWDRDLGEAGERLTESAQRMGEQSIWVDSAERLQFQRG